MSCGLLSKTELTIFDTTSNNHKSILSCCGLLSKTELTIFDTTTPAGWSNLYGCGLLSKTELTIFDTTVTFRVAAPLVVVCFQKQN